MDKAKETVCPDCDQVLKGPLGLGPHRRLKHGIVPDRLEIQSDKMDSFVRELKETREVVERVDAVAQLVGEAHAALKGTASGVVALANRYAELKEQVQGLDGLLERIADAGEAAWEEIKAVKALVADNNRILIAAFPEHDQRRIMIFK